MRISKRTLIRFVTYLMAAVLVATVFAVGRDPDAARIRADQSDGYASSFSDLAVSLKNLGYALQKTRYVSSPYGRVVLAADIQREAGAAKTALEHLPVEQGLNNIPKLFSQVSDFSFMLAKKALNGQEISEQELATMADFEKRARALCLQVEQMQLTLSDPNTGKEEFDALWQTDDTGAGVMPFFREADDAALNAAFLVYDGIYSDDRTSASSRYLSALKPVDEETAEQVAVGFLGERRLTRLGKTGSDDLCCYAFEGTGCGVLVTVHGGKILSYWRENAETDGDLTEEQAIERALLWICRVGNETWEPVYCRRADGVVSVSVCRTEDGVRIYPEQMTVGVSVQTGQIVFLNASEYYRNRNSERTMTFSLSAETAAESVPELKPESVRKVVLNGMGNTEMCCYEFTVRAEDGTVLVYVNAENGREERILLLIENEFGSYTV